MRNTNKIGEKVNGKKLLRVLFTLNSFFPFRFHRKLDRIVRVFIMMLSGFFCSYKAEIMITSIFGNDYCSGIKCLCVLIYQPFDASAHNENSPYICCEGCTSLNACMAFFV